MLLVALSSNTAFAASPFVSADDVANWQLQLEACDSRLQTAASEQAQTAREDSLETDPTLDLELEAPKTLSPSLEQYCHSLLQNLLSSPWGPALEQQGASTLTVTRVATLLQMSRHYARSQTVRPMDVASLQKVLAELPKLRAEEPMGLWGRVLRWLGERLAANEPTLPAWLSGFSVPERILEWVLYLTIVATVVLALGIVANEIYQNRRGQVLAKGGGHWRGATGVDLAVVPTLDEVRQLPMLEQPAALLSLLTASLQKAGFLSTHPGLTHREIAAQSQAQGVPEHVQAVRHVASAAEQVRFGGWQPAATDVADLVEQSAMVLSSLGSSKDE